MSKLITGSINLDTILDKLKEKHSAFTKGNNGCVYVSILVWQNDTPDKYGNIFSIQLNAKKDAPDEEKKQYIGNMKFVEPIAVDDSDIASRANIDTSEIPGAEPKNSTTVATETVVPVDDLPF